MKLRIRSNSIRLRLSMTEVEELKSEGVVSSHTEFPGGVNFTYSVVADRGYCAKLQGAEMSITVPQGLIEDWADSEELSLESFIELDSGEKLRLLVEKDLRCLTERSHEDEKDLYPNPNTNC